ncbi:arsenate reductase ArsC [Egicoccus halophilus]|uniref:Putative arsenate reductase ArsC n=1 Tax=Egicoccus halophilus TaxID=1670830 RepID=A0A8J3EVW3_9ACTN|nr:arsenate reductase ArsC [Egicoccus halophilus]GGI08975.1 putative arsenate reductase ArsC [Egicoccus halophilus]
MDHDHDLGRRQALGPMTERLHRQFAGTFNEQTIERLLADSFDRLRASAHYDAFLPLLAERFAVERLLAVARTRDGAADRTPTVLFLCVHNAGRSQMAAGFLEHLAAGRVHVLSGGSAPSERINPAVVEAMAEVGIDITASYPKPWTEETLAAADVVVTMGCGDACPVLPGTRYLDWELDDPAGRALEEVRPIRDAIQQRVHTLLEELVGPRTPA